MGSKTTSRFFEQPDVWIYSTIIFSLAGGVTLGFGVFLIAILCFAAALICAYNVTEKFTKLRNRINYIIAATISGDFSYKFPESGIDESEREINHTLNEIVNHLAKLSYDARQTEQFLSVIINLVDTGIIVADTKGNVLRSNTAALRLMNLTALTNVCQFPKKSESLIIKRTDSILNEKKHSIYTVNDISLPLQTAEVESWEKLIRVLTHEILNSLTPITSIADSLVKNNKESELESSLAVISSSSKTLIDFVKGFRKFSILPEPKPKAFFVNAFLNNAVSLCKNYEQAEGVEIKVSIMPPDTMLYTDEAMLSQVVLNIMKNALEASPRHLWVSARVREDELVEIRITNDGEKIEPEIASQIFTPFFTTKPAGSGIGLSLSRRIMKRLGGTLSLSVDPCTRFTILI